MTIEFLHPTAAGGARFRVGAGRQPLLREVLEPQIVGAAGPPRGVQKLGRVKRGVIPK
jgi:hypothetical protein